MEISKQSLRQSIRKKLSLQGAALRADRSRLIAEKLFELDAFRQAPCVAFYVALPEEVDTAHMIDKALAMGKRVVVPVSDLKSVELSLYQIRNRETLQKSNFGILEPIPDKAHYVAPENVDLIIVPGLAFDSKFNRLGQGKGFYDRFLKSLRAETFKVGLGFSFQMVDQVPVGPRDVPMDLVLTD